MGVIFCQDIKIKQFNQDIPSIIFGNQKWKGADPIFIIIEELIKIERKKLISKFFIKISFKIIENKKLMEAMAWVRKYFKDASEFNKLLELEIRGINLNRLISNPIQHPIQELDEIEIKVLKIKINKKNILLEFIKKWIKNNLWILNWKFNYLLVKLFLNIF